MFRPKQFQKRFIFNYNHDNGVCTCIDGKQRITSLIKFKNNEIPVYLNGNRYYYNGCKYNNNLILSKKDRIRFNTREINTVTYNNLSYIDQTVIFNKLQNGVSLKQGELIPSMFDDEMANIFVDFCNTFAFFYL